ncbi:MAG: head GIN domain-containing protein [Bacteroidota bacterium]
MNTQIRSTKYVILLLAIVLLGCENIAVKEWGNGNIETKKIELETFSEVQLDGGFEVWVSEENSSALTIVTDENLMGYIEAEVRGDKLRIYTTESISSREGIKLYLDYTQLEFIQISGAVSLHNEKVLKGEMLDLNMSGAGSVQLDLDVKELDLNISGAGAVELEGDAESLYVSMSGAGGLNAYDLVSSECNIGISGVGGAKIHVTQKLTARVSGIGGISYKGNPSDVQKDVSGIGSINRED